jgi:hypothetical protein
MAETLLKEREGRVATGQPILPRADKTRYEEARDDLLTYYEVYGKRDVAEAKGRLAHLDPYFTACHITGIGPAEVEAYAKKRQDEGAAAGTINRELATLSKMLHLAHEHNKLVRVPVIKKLREADPRAGFVDDAEFGAITKHLPVELAAGALVAFQLGWRKREVFGLQLRQLDLDVGTLRLDPGETKNREGRVGVPDPGAKGGPVGSGGPREGPGAPARADHPLAVPAPRRCPHRPPRTRSAESVGKCVPEGRPAWRPLPRLAPVCGAEHGAIRRLPVGRHEDHRPQDRECL